MAGKPNTRKAASKPAGSGAKSASGAKAVNPTKSSKKAAKPELKHTKHSAKSAALVYQLKISLAGIEPVIWRRVQVSEQSTFWDLHVAIQNAMGWSDAHLHEFRTVDPRTGHAVRIGLPDREDADAEAVTLPGWDVPISRYLDLEHPSAYYVYDFGDDWWHEIVLESIEPAQRDVRYPQCLDGERACPPEDCGGPPGYEETMRALLDPDHEEHESTLEWVGADYDPSLFEPERVRFDEPQQRWRVAFQGAEEELDEEAIAEEDDTETAKMLRGGIRKAVSEQLRTGDPPETRTTFERLLAAGIPREDVWRLLSCVLATEMFEIARQEREYDHERYVAMLNALPELPFD